MCLCVSVYARICDNRLVVAGKVRQEGVGLEWVKGSEGWLGGRGRRKKKQKGRSGGIWLHGDEVVTGTTGSTQVYNGYNTIGLIGVSELPNVYGT